jgi:hypothetical protein
MKKIFSVLAIATVFFTSCQKEIDLKLDEADSKFVIEANITTDSNSAMVSITKNAQFNEVGNYVSIKDALVTINDGSQTYILTHTGNGIYTNAQIVGEVGKTYNLVVDIAGQKFESSCKIPAPVPLVGLKPIRGIFGQPGADSSYVIIPMFQDPAADLNFYKWTEIKNDTASKALLLGNDVLINGQMNSRPIFNRTDTKNSGDTIEVIQQCLTEEVYNYFYTLSTLEQNGPGGGATPTNPPSNIKGGALGYFNAYSYSKAKIILQ